MRVEKVDGNVRVWFAWSELSHEGGAIYKDLSEEEYLRLRAELEQAFCAHGTAFDSDDGLTSFCLDCGLTWNTFG